MFLLDGQVFQTEKRMKTRGTFIQKLVKDYLNSLNQINLYSASAIQFGESNTVLLKDLP